MVGCCGCACAQPLVEHFDSVATMQGAGWILQNTSEPPGATGWFQGSTVPFAAQSTAGFIGADYQNVGVLGTISNWLILPTKAMDNGDTLRFWTRTVFPAGYADRLQVRLSVEGSSSSVGPGAIGVGDFGMLLLDINPGYSLSGPSSYPTTWTQYSVTLSGLSGPIVGRLAFRYFVENAGANGSHADFIALDTVEVAPGGALGRCCSVSTGQCALTTQTTCTAQGGAFGGPGTSCEGFTCPPALTGACCTVASGCVETTLAVCLNGGGIYRGDSTSCAAAACPLSFVYSGESVEVPDGSGSAGCGPWAAAEVFVPLSFAVGGVEAAVVVNHPWQGDVKVRLSKEGGPAVMLIDRPGQPQATYGFSSSDYGAQGSWFRATDSVSQRYDTPDVASPGFPQVSGSWRPEEALSVLAGSDSLGRWRVEVCDCAGGEGGELRAFALMLTPATTVPCYANCDGSSFSPVLGPNDFLCFLNLFAGSDQRANCDASTGTPMLTPNDFSCFLDRYITGCS
jgi:subtilisin-like proprotein convertase family protein